MAALEATPPPLPIFSTTTKCNSSSPKTLIRLKFLPSISTSTIAISPKFPLYSLLLSTTQVRFKLLSTVNEVAIAEEQEQKQEEEQISQQSNQRRKLFVFNLPWSFSVVNIKKLFAQSENAHGCRGNDRTSTRGYLWHAGLRGGYDYIFISYVCRNTRYDKAPDKLPAFDGLSHKTLEDKPSI